MNQEVVDLVLVVCDNDDNNDVAVIAKSTRCDRIQKIPGMFFFVVNSFCYMLFRARIDQSRASECDMKPMKMHRALCWEALDSCIFAQNCMKP